MERSSGSAVSKRTLHWALELSKKSWPLVRVNPSRGPFSSRLSRNNQVKEKVFGVAAVVSTTTGL
jgi:hypothetical protein